MENCDIQTKLNSDKRDAHAMAWAFTYLFSQCVATLPTDDRRKVPRYIISKRLCLELGGIKLKSIMKKVKTLLLSTILVVMFNGCAKDGETGPAGPAGKDGNSNVHSQTFNINPSQWYHVGVNGQAGDGYQTDETCSLITTDILNSGAVLVYYSTNNSLWNSLPLTVPYSGFSQSILVQYSLNQISFIVADSDNNTVQPAVVIYFKVVVMSSTQKVSNPNINWNNYNEVQAVFNLKD